MSGSTGGPGRGGRRSRHVVVALVVVVLLGVLGGITLYERSPRTVAGTAVGMRASAEPQRTIRVPADRPTDIAITSRWSVHIPAHGVAGSGAELTITPVPPSVGPTGVDVLDGARLSLSTGQPTAPWTFTWRFDQPLPAGRGLYLVDDQGDGAAYGAAATARDNPGTGVLPARLRPAVLTPNRLSGSVTITHLSFKEWLSGAAAAVTEALGTFFGQRGHAPSCTAKRPSWLRPDPVYLDDADAPMRVCVGSDPKNPDIAVVKVVNNRGGALVVTSPVRPAWVWQSVFGDRIPDWAPDLATQLIERLGVPTTQRDRTWVLPPDQEVDLGFRVDQLRGLGNPVAVTTSFSASSIAFGLISGQVSDIWDQASTLWDYAAMVGCVQGAGAQAWDDHSAGGVAQAVAALARCAVQQPETIIATARKALPAKDWQAISPAVYRTANLAKRVLTRLLIVAEATFVVADVATTLALPDSAYRISLFVDVPHPAPAATTVVTVVAADRAGNPAPGYTVAPGDPEPVEGCAASPAATGGDIVDCAPTAAGADVCWVRTDRSGLLCGDDPWHTTLRPAISSSPIPATAPTTDPAPWGLVLADGARCRLRNGGAWGGRADNLIGAYSCDRTGEYVLVTSDATRYVDTSNPVWTVRTGDLGDPGTVFPPPATVQVRTAYFAGSA